MYAYEDASSIYAPNIDKPSFFVECLEIVSDCSSMTWDFIVLFDIQPCAHRPLVASFVTHLPFHSI